MKELEACCQLLQKYWRWTIYMEFLQYTVFVMIFLGISNWAIFNILMILMCFLFCDLFPLISSVNQFKTDKVICLTQKWTNECWLINSEKIGHICTEYCQMAEKYRDICSSAISYKSTLLFFCNIFHMIIIILLYFD